MPTSTPLRLIIAALITAVISCAPNGTGSSRASEEFASGAQSRPVSDQTPSPTPYTRKPELLNDRHVLRELLRRYPADLRDAQVRGDVTLWVLVDEKGRVEKAQIKESSGRPEFDRAGLDVAREMRFAPAENNGTPVKAWIPIPLSFYTM